MTFRIPPYRFPTTIAAIDDDPHFLESLAFSLGRGLRCDAFEHPHLAQSALADRNGEQRLGQLISPLEEADLAELPGDWTDRGARLRCAKILELAADPSRYRDVSAIIADYDMPGMNGVAFFQSMPSAAAKRILLTGKADERVALQAFNAGLIDLFLTKHDPDIREQLRNAIAAAPGHYFRKLTRSLLPFFDARSFLFDPAVEQYAESQFTRHTIVEHYLCQRPSGLLGFAADGSRWLLLVQSDEDVSSIVDAGAAGSVTADDRRALAHGDVQPLRVPDEAGFLGAVSLVASVRLASGWRCSFIPAPPPLAGLICHTQPGRFQRHRALPGTAALS